jgi:hypothetical protein
MSQQRTGDFRIEWIYTNQCSDAMPARMNTSVQAGIATTAARTDVRASYLVTIKIPRALGFLLLTLYFPQNFCRITFVGDKSDETGSTLYRVPCLKAGADQRDV